MELGPPPPRPRPRPAPAGDGESSGVGVPLATGKGGQSVPKPLVAVALPRHATDACPGGWGTEGRWPGQNEEDSQHCPHAPGRVRLPDGLPQAFPEETGSRSTIQYCFVPLHEDERVLLALGLLPTDL